MLLIGQATREIASIKQKYWLHVISIEFLCSFLGCHFAWKLVVASRNIKILLLFYECALDMRQ